MIPQTMEKLTLKWYGINFRPWVYRTLFIDNVMINLYDCMGIVWAQMQNPVKFGG